MEISIRDGINLFMAETKTIVADIDMSMMSVGGKVEGKYKLEAISLSVTL